ncbi:glycosyltransferase family 4 protein [Polymorphobacter sp. PAMC 29334]|uniref:glycosyltransferase family 4 protein n=1 Tax=Polymorphobacter sp. PAMC 29334 TaxID=2862331 RepID=UPI001C66D5E2|nr:glycosyltransferase family 1 protein [Polymorphobacter sp. PAMC 29334]QYE35958.1 glycosyltransferase family 4 protein [Polymorphobacter sp. PAMC 29334]
MKTIAIDAAALAPRRTGIGNYLVNLVKGLLEIADGVHFVFYSNAPVLVDDLPGVVVRVSQPVGRRGPYWQNTQLGPALIADRPAVFWGVNGLLPIVRPRTMRTVVTVMDLVYHFAGETTPPISRLSRRLLQPYAVRAADRITTISDATAADVLAVYGRSCDAVIRPVVNQAYGPSAAADRARVIAKHNLPRDYLLTLGTLEPRKNLVELVRAILLLAGRNITLPPLVIAGGRGWSDGALTRAIEEGEAAGVVRRLGFVDDADMPGLYAGACLFLLASRYEGFGMPVVEAQLCGIPVAVSDIPSLRESSGGYAIFFAPTAEGIADCLAGIFAGTTATVSRPLATIDNDPNDAARRMWSVIQPLL